MLFPGVELSPEALKAIGEKMKDLEMKGVRLDPDRDLILGVPTISEEEGLGDSWIEIPPKHWSTKDVVESIMVH